MRIIYLHQYFNTLESSGGTRSFELARRLVRQGHVVHMVTSTRRSKKSERAKWRHEVIDGIHVHQVYVPYSNAMSYTERIHAFVRFAILASWKVTRLRADLVFATSTPLTIIIPAWIASRWQRIPLVFEVRDLWPEVPIAIGALKNRLVIYFTRWLERFAYRSSRHIVALSPGMKQGVERVGIPSSRITVIPNGSDVELFRNVNARECQEFQRSHEAFHGSALITYTGTVGRVNGVKYLVDIAKEMLPLDAEVRFLIVGKGAEWQAVHEYAKELGVLNRNLYLMKEVPKRDMPFILSGTTVATSLVINHPVMWNNSANKFFDALAASKPIMINYEGWQAEIIWNSGAGIVVPPDDPEAACRALYDFITDKERLQRAAVAAGKLAIDEFDRDKLADKLIGILETVGLESQELGGIES